VSALHHVVNTRIPFAGLAVFSGWTAMILGGGAYRLVYADDSGRCAKFDLDVAACER
jgi:hypothetical protein